MPDTAKIRAEITLGPNDKFHITIYADGDGVYPHPKGVGKKQVSMKLFEAEFDTEQEALEAAREHFADQINVDSVIRRRKATP